MPKIADIQETPNPNAVKFILKEPVSYGTSHSFKTAEAAAENVLAKSLFDIGEVVSVFYMDKMITVEKTDDAEWDELLPTLAVPIRAAEAVTASNGNAKKAAAAAVGGSIAAAASDDPKLAGINELLDLALIHIWRRPRANQGKSRGAPDHLKKKKRTTRHTLGCS